MPAPPLSPDKIADILRVYAECGSFEQAANRLGLSRGTVSKYVRRADTATVPNRRHSPAMPTIRLPDPAPEAGGPGLPEPEYEAYEDYRVDTAGAWLVMSDLHLPYHDKRAIELAVAEADRRRVTGIVLNGDVLDFYQVSRYSRDPSKPRIKCEIEKGRQLLEYLRSKFPRARLIFKEGNHDERLRNFLADRAPELFDLDEIHLPALLHASAFGVEWVGDRRVIQLGKLPVIHGHEYRGSGGVMPARWLFIRAWSSAMCGHFHQPSHFPATSLDNREMGVWSLGCLCFLHPYYSRKNAWRHGYAVVEVHPGGQFEVANREVLKNGQVV